MPNKLRKYFRVANEKQTQDPLKIINPFHLRVNSRNPVNGKKVCCFVNLL